MNVFFLLLLFLLIFLSERLNVCLLQHCSQLNIARAVHSRNGIWLLISRRVSRSHSSGAHPQNSIFHFSLFFFFSFSECCAVSSVVYGWVAAYLYVCCRCCCIGGPFYTGHPDVVGDNWHLDCSDAPQTDWPDFWHTELFYLWNQSLMVFVGGRIAIATTTIQYTHTVVYILSFEKQKKYIEKWASFGVFETGSIRKFVWWLWSNHLKFPEAKNG